MKNILDTPYVYMELKDGVIIGHYKSNQIITLEKAKEIVAARYEYFEKKSYPVLIFDTGVKSMEKEARDFFATREGNLGITAGAIVVKSSFTMMMVNFLFQVSRPVIPCKIFTDEQKAMEWLKKYIN